MTFEVTGDVEKHTTSEELGRRPADEPPLVDDQLPVFSHAELAAPVQYKEHAAAELDVTIGFVVAGALLPIALTATIAKVVEVFAASPARLTDVVAAET